jgi:hypothetical protein
MLELIMRERTGMPSQYRLIQVSVTAIQLTPDSFDRARIFCGGVPVTEMDPFDSKKQFVAPNIPTIAGTVRAGQGDYIIKDAFGVISVLSAKEFERRYERV